LENFKKNIIEFFKLPYTGILFVILPLGLLTGSFLSDLIVSIIALSTLFTFFRNKLNYLYKNKYIFFFIIYSAYLTFLSLNSNFLFLSLEASLFYIRFIFFSLAISLLINSKSKIEKFFFYSLFSIFSILFIDSIIQYFFRFNLFGMSLIQGRVSSFFGDELIMGSFISRLTPLLIGGFLLLNINKHKNLFIGFIFAISTILVLLSGERTALFNFIFFIILFSLFGNYNLKLIKKYIYIFLVMILSFFVIEALVLDRSDSKNRFFNKTTEQLFSETSSGKKINFYSETHEKLAITSINIWNNNIIFGAGPKTFRKECSQERILLIENNQLCATHPHNIFFQLLAETGVIGIFFYFIFVLILLLDFINLRKNKLSTDSSLYNFKLCLIISLLISIIPFIPGPNFFGNYINIIFYIPMGFYMYYFNKIKL
jgi:O-antigen ligase